MKKVFNYKIFRVVNQRQLSAYLIFLNLKSINILIDWNKAFLSLDYPFLPATGCCSYYVTGLTAIIICKYTAKLIFWES